MCLKTASQSNAWDEDEYIYMYIGMVTTECDVPVLDPENIWGD